jgi:electron transfer flavoprotein beta subunit
MNIIVFIKQVPSTNNAAVGSDNTLIREGTGQIINPADLNALEEALRIKEKTNGCVTVCTMGPASAESILRQAGGMGADNLYLISDPLFAGSDTYATASVLSFVVRKLGFFDLILCGRRSLDGETGQVGPEIAALLGLPCAVNCVELKIKKQNIYCVRMMEHDLREELFPIPSVVTIYNSINSPRLPSIQGLRHLHNNSIKLITSRGLGISPNKCGLNGSPTKVIHITSKTYRKRAAVWKSDKEGALHILKLIKETQINGVV